MVDIAEFLLARIAEEEDADRERFLDEIPADRREEAAAAWDRLAMTAWLRAGIAMRQAGCALLAAFGLHGILRRRAESYADHADYREEWRP